MKHWNYRLVRRLSRGDVYIAIHEAYYDEYGKCVALTDDEVGAGGETPEETRSAYEMMNEAFTKPILDYETREEINDYGSPRW